ncbi:MAG TPA: YqaE/Pmp3 family membrane protein [Bacteroidia bacterium]|jgi:uncharacterized membrane protein YqaE (UPF0057 family)|nr:YqaE/Pmp3 family membrane protein [Bacteroidia bacterium]
MKKQINTFIFFAAIGMLLSSCSNLSKISIAKRHYRSGYYVNFGQKNHTSATAITAARISAKPNPKPQVPSAIIAAKQSNPIAVNASKATEVNISAPQKVTNPIEIKHINNISTYSTPSFAPNISATVTHSSESESEAHARVDVDVSYVVIILCAIFIPPLGVGLMYGIDSYFWIDLILTLLFFFPGMIFALIVVLM